MKGLIIGFGRAGRRHARALSGLGVKWAAVEPDASQRADIGIPYQCYQFLYRALEQRFDFAVVCTPPDLHLAYVSRCLAAGLPVLCEKPLCGWGQVAEAEELPPDAPVMLAFNYRFHPEWMEVKEGFEYQPKWWQMVSIQHRPDLPSWGLILDHLPHSIDRLFWLGVEEITIKNAYQGRNDKNWVNIRGYADGEFFDIYDSITETLIEKIAINRGPFGGPFTPSPRADEMMANMYQSFFAALDGSGPWSPGLADGLRVQRVLEEIRSKLDD